MKIYTKAGDKGQTTLAGGQTISKNHRLVEAYGTIDELSSFIGLASAELGGEKLAKDLIWVQRRLFIAGSVLAGGPGEVKAEDLTFLETAIDRISEELPPLQDFIVPGGSKGAALLHVARGVCRRAERLIVGLEQAGTLPAGNILPFVNRLSDYLFCAARLANLKEGVDDILAKEAAEN